MCAHKVYMSVVYIRILYIILLLSTFLIIEINIGENVEDAKNIPHTIRSSHTNPQMHCGYVEQVELAT